MKIKPAHCPSCGFLRATAEDIDICPACFFGGSRDPEEHRAAWNADGRPWMSQLRPQPAGWDPDTTMAEAARAITLAKVKGRPPRLN